MSTMSKLEKAVSEQASDLMPAQRELVMSQLRTYRWNLSRIAQIETKLALLESGRQPADAKERKAQLAEKKELRNERHQLTVDCTSISSKLFMHLKDTGSKDDDFDDFMKNA